MHIKIFKKRPFDLTVDYGGTAVSSYAIFQMFIY